MLGRPHRKRCCEVCCLPFPMRLARFGRGSRRPSAPTPLRPASNQVPQQSGPDGDLGPGKTVKYPSPSTKNPSGCNLHQRKKERFESFNTVSRKHAKYSHSLLPLEPAANRGQVSKLLHQFTVIRSTLPAKRYILYFNRIHSSSQLRVRGPASPPVSG